MYISNRFVTGLLAATITLTPLLSLADEALQEIVVTAQKREESLQQVPIAIQAFSGGQLANAHIENTQDLRFLVPTLQYSTDAAYATPFLRGVGTDVIQPNSDPLVATYVDGAFVASSLGTISNLLAVERVEVLKGPQGTLYGRNAVGGAINIITLTPTSKPEAEVSVGGGNFSLKEVTAHVSGAIADHWFAGLYTTGSWRDSIYSDVGPVVKAYPNQPKDESQWGVRGKLVYDSGEKWKLTLSVEHTKESGRDAATSRQIQNNALGYAFGAPAVNQAYVVSEDFGNKLQVLQDAIVLREEFDLGGPHILGITAYRKTDASLFFDYDGTAAPAVSLSVDPQSSKAYSQELQLLSPNESKLKWVAGVFLYREIAGFHPTSIHAPILFGSVGLPAISSVTSEAKTTSAAAFGQITYPFTDELSVTLGARFTSEKKVASARNDLVDVLHGVPVLSFSFPDAEKRWSQFTPRIALDYQLPSTLLYASYSRGFKSGVYNLAAPTDFGPVDPQTLDAYEVGAKAELADKRIRFNNAAYFYNLKNIQTQISTANSGAVTILRNAAAAQAYGLESELLAAVSSNFTVSASVAWEHSRYTKFPNFAGFIDGAVGNTPATIDVSGNQIKRTPEWLGSLGAQYTIDVASGGELTGRLNGLYNGAFYWDASNAPQTREDAYITLDGSVSFRTQNKNWLVSVWGRNLTNKYYRTGLIENQFGNVVSDATPRTYGVRVTYDF